MTGIIGWQVKFWRLWHFSLCIIFDVVRRFHFRFYYIARVITLKQRLKKATINSETSL
jgi:hypothetical protein